MAVLVSDVVAEILYDIAEDSGLQLGILTNQQLIDAVNETLLDFLKQCGLVKYVWTMTVNAGLPQFTVPDTMMMTEEVFLAGRYLERSTVEQLYNQSRDWRRKPGLPNAWHMDGLPVKTIEVAPTPNYNGTAIPGVNEPAPPHAQAGNWSVQIPLVGGSTVTAPSHRGLTMVGSQKPTLVTALTDPIPLLPADIALSALPFGVLQRIFQGDNELKDPDRANWAAAQYQEMVQVCQAVSGYLGMES